MTVKNAPAINSKFQKYILVALAALIFAIYLPGNKEFFTLDDADYVTNNKMVQAINMANIKAMFKTPVNGNYHPLTMLSLALDFKLHKLNPRGYYITSLVLHLLSSILLFFFILRLRGNTWIAAMVAVLFAIHPMHVESVVWISERKDQLYVLFYLASLLFYLKYLRSKYEAKYLWYTGLFFLFSLLSKGQAVTLPLSLLLVDYVTKRTWDKKSIYEKIPFFILSFVFGMVAYYCQASLGAVTSKVIEDLSFPERLMMACFAIWNYIYKLFLPLQLSVLHPYPEKINGIYPLSVYLSPLFVAGLIAFVIWKWRHNRDVVFGMAFFFVNILLLLQLIPVGGAIFSERYSYLAYIGLFYIIALGLFYIWEQSKNKSVVTGGVAVYLLILGLTAHERKQVWASNKTIWSNVVQQYPTLSFSYMKLGFIYYRESENGSNRQKTDSAFINLDKAVGLGWKSLSIFGLRGDVNRWLGRPESAIADYTRALRFAEDPKIRYNRGQLYVHLKSNTGSNIDSAIVDFKHIVNTNPDEGGVYGYLGDLYWSKGLKDTAAQFYRQALSRKIEPGLKQHIEKRQSASGL